VANHPVMVKLNDQLEEYFNCSYESSHCFEVILTAPQAFDQAAGGLTVSQSWIDCQRCLHHGDNKPEISIKEISTSGASFIIA
jgi:hypothetical protein